MTYAVCSGIPRMAKILAACQWPITALPVCFIGTRKAAVHVATSSKADLFEISGIEVAQSVFSLVKFEG